MPRDHFSQLVSDWGGFEKFIETLHDIGEVTVQRDVTLVGRSGAPRQIDVLVTHRAGLYVHQIVIECKYWNKPVERQSIDALVTTVTEVGASRGVIFSKMGFQSGAISEARHHSIELFKIRELTDIEWGTPGRHFDMWLHVVGFAIGDISVDSALSVGSVSPQPIHLNLFETTETVVQGVPEKTFEGLMLRLAHDGARRAYNPIKIHFSDGSYNGRVIFVVEVNFEPSQPVIVFATNGTALVPRFSFKLGVEVSQSRIQIDRLDNFHFVLAVEDCVRQKVFAASRRNPSEKTIIVPACVSDPIQSQENYMNGSLGTVWVKGFQPFEPFTSLKPGQAVELPALAL